MTVRTILVAALLALSPVAGFTMCAPGAHEAAVDPCLDGMVWDPETELCVEVTTG